MYTHKQKKVLANKISQIESVTDIAVICQIIKNDGSFDYKKSVTQNNNGIFMYFHNLEDETYNNLEKYIIGITKTSEYSSEDRKCYTPYNYDEFELSPSDGKKMKYSNKEKSLLKRQRYEQESEEQKN